MSPTLPPELPDKQRNPAAGPDGRDAREPQDGRSAWPLLDNAPNPRLTFDTIVPCRVNEFTLEIARVAASGSRGSTFNPCYIYGEVGTGKTHLLSAIANEAGPRRARLVNTADLEVEFERAQREAQRSELRQWLSSTDILLFDDIQLCENHAALQNEVFALINHIIRDGKIIVVSSDVSPTRLRHVQSRLLSRLGAGVIVGLGVGDVRERMAIVRRHAGEPPLPEPVVSYLAEQISDSVRRLKAAVTQLVAHRAHTGIEADLDLARAIVPMPEDIRSPAVQSLPPAKGAPPRPDPHAEMAERFKRMLRGAETPEEQALALEIAMGEAIRTLRVQGGNPDRLRQLESALFELREGNLDRALQGFNL